MTVSDVLNQPGQAPAENGSAAPTISEEVIRNSPAYRALLSESIERRQMIAALKQELEALKPKETAQTPQTPASSEPVSALEKQIAALAEMVEGLTKRVENDAKARVDMTRAGLIQQHNIPSELQGFVNGATEDEVRAQVNALLPYITPAKSNVGAGNVGAPVSDEDLISQMRGILEGKPAFDPFDPGIQRKMGGGPQ